MENATKALLIAAAILIAIILISLGIAVVQSGSSALEQADLSDTEKTAFNMKFQNYESTRASVTDVNNLLSTVLNHNINETAEGTKRLITVYEGAVGETGTKYLATNAKNYTKVTGSGYYTIACQLDTSAKSATSGLVYRIFFVKN